MAKLYFSRANNDDSYPLFALCLDNNCLKLSLVWYEELCRLNSHLDRHKYLREEIRPHLSKIKRGQLKILDKLLQEKHLDQIQPI